MTETKKKGPLFDPGLCRCCGTMKKCRVLNVEYESFGEKEVYSDMFMDCFGLLLSHLDDKPCERLICATCVLRLREAFAFKKQVLQFEEAFLQMKVLDMDVDTGDDMDSNTVQQDGPISEVTVEIVKQEPSETEKEGNDSDGVDADDHLHDTDESVKPENAEEDVPLQTLRSRPREVMMQSWWMKQHKPQAPASKRAERSPDEPRDKTKPPIQQIQQINREKDKSYKIETNIITLIEYSYICPFKCRHNYLLCHYCGAYFTKADLLREHTNTQHTPKKFKITDHKNVLKVDLTRIDCRLCAAKIDDLDAFKRHVVEEHGKKYYFDSKDSVLPFKLDGDVLKCALCNVCFPYFHALNKHMNEHYSNFICETCGLGFVDNNRFVMHQARHEQGEYPCATCGKQFKCAYNRDLHIDRVHKKRGRVYCPKCDVRLMSHPQKMKHLVEVHGEQPISLPCTECDKVFESRRMLTIHWRKDHLKDFRYECQVCGQKFFTRFALSTHMPTHTLERNYKCKVCEKSYPRLKTLKEHMRIHNNDRRYRCHICGQAFIQNCSLKGHMKSQHPEFV